MGLHRRAGGGTMQLAAELAGRLHLDLVGLFIADSRLSGLAGLPFVREFRPFGGGWQPLQTERLARELEMASEAMQRTFTAAVEGVPTACRFEVARGTTATAFGQASQAGDILMIEEPASAAEQATEQSRDLIEAALRSSASVLLVPRQFSRVRGVVVAVAARPDDPSIRIATALASAIGQDLVILETFEAPEPSATQPQASPRVARIRLGAARGQRPISDVAALAQVLRSVQERMIVISRTAASKTLPLLIVAARRVPVLIVDPAEDANHPASPQSSKRA